MRGCFCLLLSTAHGIKNLAWLRVYFVFTFMSESISGEWGHNCFSSGANCRHRVVGLFVTPSLIWLLKLIPILLFRGGCKTLLSEALRNRCVWRSRVPFFSWTKQVHRSGINTGFIPDPFRSAVALVCSRLCATNATELQTQDNLCRNVVPIARRSCIVCICRMDHVMGWRYRLHEKHTHAHGTDS